MTPVISSAVTHSQHKLTFKTGLDFSAMAFKSSIPAFKAVVLLEEDWAVKAAAEAAREAKMASFMVVSFSGQGEKMNLSKDQVEKRHSCCSN